MAHTYILFDFGADEESAQKARHKLEGWKQAFRLDKKLQFKFERGESPSAEPAAAAKAEQPRSKTKGKTKTEAPDAATTSDGTVRLLVRLYFSTHEKLSEQRWIGRIPAEEPFKGATPKVVHESEEEFPEIVKQFDSLE